MRRTTVTAALGLALVLAGCSDDGDTGTEGTTTGTTTEADADAATATGDAAGETAGAAAVSDDPACTGFFANGAVTLAERAGNNRDVLEAGDTLDPASWGEINLLSQRIVSLSEDASGEQAQLLERVNAPFVEASQAVLEDEEQAPTDPEITVPEIDVTDSAAAQDELEAACAG